MVDLRDNVFYRVRSQVKDRNVAETTPGASSRQRTLHASFALARKHYHIIKGTNLDIPLVVHHLRSAF